MLHSSIGYHTFNMVKRYAIEDGKKILDDFKEYNEKNKCFKIYPTDASKTCYRADYLDKHVGIDYWQFRFFNSAKDFKKFILEAKINPKILSGEVDYVRAATQEHLPIAENRFNEEARKISRRLGNFSSFKPNRIDFCVNLDLLELKLPCTDEQMMELLSRGHIPPHYVEYKTYDPVAHRMKAPDNSFYLKSKSVNINCYGKHNQLEENYPDNPSLEDSLAVIRVEVQYKYLKLYNLVAALEGSGVPSYSMNQYLFSDDLSKEIVEKYYNRIFFGGDYYTLKEATDRIRARNFRGDKERRLIDTLNDVSCYRGVHNAELHLLGSPSTRRAFKQAISELVEENINPVTIPRDWGIPFIPNPLQAYFKLVDSQQDVAV